LTGAPPRKEVSTRKSKIFESRSSRSNTPRPKSVRVADEDVTWHTWFDIIPSVLVGGILGYLGSVFLWLGLAVAYPFLFDFPYALAFQIVGVTALTLLAAFRNRLLARISSRGFVFTFVLQRTIFNVYYGAFLLALYPLFSSSVAIAGYSPPLLDGLPASTIVLIGLYFFLIAPRFIFSRLLGEIREARLSLLQFLAEWVTENPSYSWLRRGMRGVAQQLTNSGLSVAPGVLFHGASYSLFRETLSRTELKSLAEWLIHPARFQQANSVVRGLIWESRQAENVGFGKARGVFDRLVALPWQKAYGVTVAISVVVGAIAAIINLLQS